jgi:integrase/recombinase XerC
LSSRTHAVHIKALRKLFVFLLSESMVLHNPFASLTMPREGRPLPRNILSQDDIVELLRNMKARDPVGIRNRAIVELLYACGMRTSELCNLRVGDVDLREQTATILHGKGDKTRIVPIGQYASHFVGQYLEKARRHMLKGRKEDAGFLFLSQRGNPFDRSSLNKCVLRAVGRLLPKQSTISAYGFRHAIASHLLANDVDVSYIAKLLGHESLRTTQRYLRLEIGDLKRIHSLCHPREKCLTDSRNRASTD